MTLALRRFERGDIALLKSWFPTREDVLQWAGASLQYPVRDSDLKALIRAHRGPAPSHEVWAVIDAISATVGHVQMIYNHRLRQATLGRIAIAPGQRGQGLAAPLLRLALAQAFSNPQTHRIELRVYDFNHAAIAVYRRAGFTDEGTRRDATPVGTGFWSTKVMSLLRPEYETFDKRTEGE